MVKAKVNASDILNQYTQIVGGEREVSFDGVVLAQVYVRSAFETFQEAHEWEDKFKQFILENRPSEINQ